MLATLAAAPAPAQAADPIMRLSEVRQGMRCTGLSVVRGTAISSFDVEILDVVTGDAKATGPRLLVRVSGPAVTPSGVGPGFSGSPIYCPDAAGVRKNAGAISEISAATATTWCWQRRSSRCSGQGPDAPRSARRDQRLLGQRAAAGDAADRSPGCRRRCASS